MYKLITLAHALCIYFFNNYQLGIDVLGAYTE